MNSKMLEDQDYWPFKIEFIKNMETKQETIQLFQKNLIRSFSRVMNHLHLQKKLTKSL